MTSAIDRFKKRTPAQAERYRLSVSGIVTYTADDFHIRDLLLKGVDTKAMLAEALQELEEEASDIKITMEEL